MTRWRAGGGLAGMVAAGILAACGSAASGSGADGGAPPTPVTVASINPCTLISTDVATQALGEAVKAPAKTAVGGINGCAWQAAAAAAVTDMVIVDVDTRDSFDAAAQSANQGGGATITKISGLGDDAFFYTVGPNTSVEARKGGLMITVNVTKGGAFLRDQAVTVARAAIAKLP